MSRDDPSHLVFFTKLGNIIGERFGIIAGGAGIMAFILTLVQLFFDVQFSLYGPVIVRYVTSNDSIFTLLVVSLIAQVMLYQRVEWIVRQLEPDIESGNDSEGDTDSGETITDGGWRNQPRDDRGRFTAKESGGSNLIILILAGVLGYTAGTEVEGIGPIVGALIGIAIVAFLQSNQ